MLFFTKSRVKNGLTSEQKQYLDACVQFLFFPIPFSSAKHGACQTYGGWSTVCRQHLNFVVEGVRYVNKQFIIELLTSFCRSSWIFVRQVFATHPSFWMIINSLNKWSLEFAYCTWIGSSDANLSFFFCTLSFLCTSNVFFLSVCLPFSDSRCLFSLPVAHVQY